MDYIERIKSKNWKERQEVYLELGNHFKEGKNLEFLHLLQNETNIPALESAIDSILKAPIISTSAVSKIFLQIGNSKTTIKNRIFNLIDNIKDSDLVPTLVQLLSNKNPKIVSNTLISLNRLYENNKNLPTQDSLEALNLVLGHSDSVVRSEGLKFTVLLYKIVGNEVKKYLNIKPILLKELEEEFNKISPQSESISVDLDYSKINDSKWNIRVEGLTQLLNSPYNDNIVDVLFQRINDPNNQVFFLVLDVIYKFKVKDKKIINGLIERLKDKKTCITDKIKKTLIHVGVEHINTQYFMLKSPELKANLIEVCTECKIIDKEVIKCIIKCTEDSSSMVRNKAFEALRMLDYDKNLLSSDLRKKINPNETSANVIVGNKVVPVQFTKKSITPIKKSITPIKKIVTPSKQNFTKKYTKKGQPAINKEILESFQSKYPFILDKTWTVRIEGINANKKYLLKEDLLDFARFLFSVKDPNFQVNILYLNLIIERKAELVTFLDVQEVLIYYCVDKCTEAKMKSKIFELFGVFNRSLVIEILVEVICLVKKGKKFVELVKLLSEYHKNEREIEDVFKVGVTGLQEKKAVEGLKNTFKVQDSSFILDVKNEEGKSVNISCESKEQNSSFLHEPNENSRVQNDSKCSDHSSKTTNVNLFEPSPASNSAIDIINLINEKNVDTIFSLLDSLDLISHSSKIIEMSIYKDVQSTFFNTLMIHFVSKKYILSKEECQTLVKHYLSKGFYEELNMIDRVYPLTKLFLILKNILVDTISEKSEHCIVSLLKRYVTDSNSEIIKENIKNSENFLDFLDKCNNKSTIYKDAPKFNTCVFGTPVKDVKVINNITKITNNMTDSKDENNLPDTKNNMTETKIKNNMTDAKDENNLPDTKNIMTETKIKGNLADTKTFNKLKEPKCNSIPLNLIAPSVFEANDLNIDIETSLDCLNLSGGARLTPNAKKFRKEFFSPRKNVENLEDILDNIIDSDQNKSEEAFKRLSEIINNDINVVLFSANSIVSSISIQLLDVLHRPLYAKLILNVLLKLSQSRIFCEQIRKEILESVNVDLINIIKNEDLSDVVSDILTNLCLNCKMSVILEVYFRLLDSSSVVKNDIPLKLIWRHSKSIDFKNTEEIQRMFQILEEFFKKAVFTEILENTTTFKISILHLRECCVYFQDKIGRFNLGKYIKKIIDKILNDDDINIGVVRVK